MSVKKKRVTGQPGRPSKYGPEFQRDAVARSLGVNDGTLSNWVSKQRVARAAGADLGADERVELSELRRQVGELRMERDLLKRSLAFWVKESTQ
jgi:transposase